MGARYIDLMANESMEDHCDICIIGAGAAGIFLAVELARQGKYVVLVEAGNSICSSAENVGFESIYSNDFYPGAVEGRAFGIGGTTSRWGGLLVPHSNHDILRTDNTLIWKHIVQTVSKNSPKVLKKLGYKGNGEFGEFACGRNRDFYSPKIDKGLDIITSLIIPFQKKNFSFLLKQEFCGCVKVYFNSVMFSSEFSAVDKGNARIVSISATSANGNFLKVCSDNFIIAAGAIESARILLELNSQSSVSVIQPSAAIGCYLSDHLSVTIADVADSDTQRAINLFSPFFSNDWIRSYRFLERNPPINSPRAFAHFIFQTDSVGINLTKEILRAIQARRWPKISPDLLVAGMVDIGLLAYKRYVHSQLYLGQNTSVHMQLDIEQVPQKKNCVKLGNSRDRYNRPIVDIYWSIGDIDCDNIRSTAKRFLKLWEFSKKKLPKLISKVGEIGLIKPHDAYHPVGTCRMGMDAEAVVDLDLKVRGTSNLWIVSTGVLPSAGTANPTFTMLCLAQELVEYISARSRR